ncbi:MAG: GNAT family N-acetyltransferase [Acidobacteriia bacterium]|nr:GNAT family N-acetyltransferase [Terriglobia bacterium]
MPVVELLQGYHDRQTFSCGNATLDEFLRRQARQNADRNLGVTHVVVASAGDSRVLGYYTLVTRTVETAIIPSKGLPQGPIGVVLLGRLAVDRSCQHQGIGRLMLMRALRQTEEAARVMGIYALVLDAIDDSARKWYLGLGWGFQTLVDDSRHLFLPAAVIRKLGLS